MKGNVALVGAGPGDPGLLTLRGRELLEHADVVVYDRLISPELLNHAPHARRINVGKTQGNHPVPQDRINQILLEEAEKGGLVVRLKGGDPCLFGRGGEEAAFLEAHGIPCQIVPGVTSALAALAYAGIPATCRELAGSAHIITGHARENQALDLDFHALSQVGGTLIFLMAVSAMAHITQGLLSAGMDPDTPAAVVERGTCPGQRRITGTLATIVDRSAEVRSPAILAVGEVCKLNVGLSMPLAGRVAVLTRPEGRGGELAAALRMQGAQVFSLPCVDLRPVDPGSVPTEGADWIALTSPEGVSRLFALLDQRGQDARSLAGIKIAAVGRGTAQALAQHGVRADCVPSQPGGAALSQALLPLLRPGERVRILGAARLSPGLPEGLTAAGVAWEAVPLYETVPQCRPSQELADLLDRGEADWIVFASGSAVEGFASAFPDLSPERFTAVCAGAGAQSAAEKRGYRLLRTDLDGIAGAILSGC